MAKEDTGSLFEIEVDNSGNRKSFLFEDRSIARAEIVSDKEAITSKSGEIQVFGGSKIKKRIHYRILAMIQKRNASFPRKEIEDEAIRNVSEKLRKNELIYTDEKGTEKCLITPKTYEVAVNQEINSIIRTKIGNKFHFTKEEILLISKNKHNNIYHLEKVLNNMRSDEMHVITELETDDNFQNIIERKMSIRFITGYGYAYINNDATMDENSIEMRNDGNFSFKDLPSDSQIVIEIHPDFIPYLIAPNKNSFTKGFIKLFNDTIESFEFEHTLALYKIVVESEKIWQDVKFTYLELLKRFGSNKGKKKKLNPKYNPETMHISKKYLMNAKNEYIYELDSNNNFIYESDYIKTYRFFKSYELSNAIKELNETTPYFVNLIEHRQNNSPRGLLKYVQFQIIRKNINKQNNNMKYSSIGYYATTRLFFYKFDNKQELINNLKKYAEHLDEKFQKEFKEPILELQTLSELTKRAELNSECILKIKNLLNENHLELSKYKFSEEYLVVFDVSKKQILSGGIRLYPRLGNDAIVCWEHLMNNYPELINKLPEIKKTFIDFLKFEFYSEDEQKFITVTKKNYLSYESEIDKAIKTAKKNYFKSFKNIKTKRLFYDTLF